MLLSIYVLKVSVYEQKAILMCVISLSSAPLFDGDFNIQEANNMGWNVGQVVASATFLLVKNIQLKLFGNF